MSRSILVATLALAILIPVGGTWTPASAATGTTLDNLQAAYNGESNARVRYVAFAEKAQQEGYGPVASLFRAAARAEEIHANNHAVVIKALGAAPKATIETPLVQSTGPNLKEAVKGEIYERDVMYPEFIEVAKKEGRLDALRSFNYAKAAEAGHATLYGQAGKDLPNLTGAGVTYYVCEVCGLTTTNLDFARCVSCLSPKDKYVAVS
jgi:rubrerythrin